MADNWQHLPRARRVALFEGGVMGHYGSDPNPLEFSPGLQRENI